MSRRGTSRTRTARTAEGCRSCSLAGCCACCNNWCHICGVAKCRAARSTKWQDDALNTQYKRDYPPKFQHVDKRIPAPGPLQSMPFFSTTTNRADFTPKKSRTQSARPADVAIPAHRLDASTTYNAHYPPKSAELEEPPKPVYPAWTAPFVGATTYDSDYLARRVRPWTTPEPTLPPQVPFDGTTEYNDHFHRKPIPPPHPGPPRPLLPSSHVPTITTYGHDYVPKPFERRERLHCCDDNTHPGTSIWKVRLQDRPCCRSCAHGGICTNSIHYPRPVAGTRPTG